MRRLAEGIAMAGHALLWIFSLRALPNLPARIPVHFDLSGQADRWSEGALAWLSMPMFATGMAIALLLLTFFLQKRPDMVNVPGKARVQKLPPRFRGPVSEAVREMMALVQVEMIVIFCLVQRGIWAGAMGEPAEVWTTAVMFTAIMSSPVLLVVIMTRFPAAVEAGWKKARAEGIQED